MGTDWTIIRGNTNVYAHEGATKYSSISTDHRGGHATIRDLYDEFINEWRGQRTLLADQQLEIRFVFPATLIVRIFMGNALSRHLITLCPVP